MSERTGKTPEKKNLYLVFKQYMYSVLDFIHALVSVTIVAAIAVTLLSLPHHIMLCTDIGSKSLISFLEYVINIIIAVELIHVLLHQSLDTIVEILSLAITRELILEKMHTYELFIGVAAIALLFVIRKYLVVMHKDTENKRDPGYSLEREMYDPDDIVTPHQE